MGKKPKIILIGMFFLLLSVGTMLLNTNKEINKDASLKSDVMDQPIKEIDINTPKDSGFWDLNNITIDDDGGTYGALKWDQAVAEDWCYKQNGLYIIENVTINAGGTGDGILIRDSTVPFIIRNCTVYNAEGGGSGGIYAGIKLYQTSNGTITNNNCSNNLVTGIRLENMCKNNTISYNTVTDNNQHGIYILDDCDDNTVFNNTINETTTGIQYNGIWLNNNCDNNTISNNTLNGNTNYGIRINYNSYDNIIANNTINSFDKTDYGILLVNAENTILSGNIMTECVIYLEGFSLSSLKSHNIYTNNTVNGKSVYYYTDQSNLNTDNFTLTGDPGQIILVNCRDSVITEFNLSYSTVGIQLYYSENITISNNEFEDNRIYGIYLKNYCMNNTIFNNTIDGIDGGNDFSIGISLENYCSENNITKNFIKENYNGLELRNHCDNNTIFNNTATYNYGATATDGYGIYLVSHCEHNDIINNIATKNGYAGIVLWSSSYNTANDNTVNDNDNYGIYLGGDSDNNNITSNIASNTGGLIQGDGIRLTNGCDQNLIEDNTMTGNKINGIYINLNCHNNIILNNTASANLISGIYLFQNCDNNFIINNTVIDNSNYGIYINLNCDFNNIIGNMASNTGLLFQEFGIILENECTENIIEKNNLTANADYGINLIMDCSNNDIIANNLYKNGLSGIFLDDNSTNNQIARNNATFNGKAGIQLNASNSNRIYDNIAKNNTFGLLLNSSSYNCIYGNTLVNNTIDYFESGICVGNGDCRISAAGGGGGGDDDGKDDKEEATIPGYDIYILVGIISIISIVLIKKRWK